MNKFEVGQRVRVVGIVDDAESLERFTGLEGVVSSIYPGNAPFPIYVDFDEDKQVPFALSEVEVV